MSDLVENHIVGFPTRRLICFKIKMLDKTILTLRQPSCQETKIPVAENTVQYPVRDSKMIISNASNTFIYMLYGVNFNCRVKMHKKSVQLRRACLLKDVQN